MIATSLITENSFASPNLKDKTALPFSIKFVTINCQASHEIVFHYKDIKIQEKVSKFDINHKIIFSFFLKNRDQLIIF